MSPLETISLLNCLLYADDVVLIAERTTMTALLRKCEEHSLQMGYLWNTSKHVILDNQLEPIPYTIYNQSLPQVTSFVYLGVPFKPGGYLDPDELIRRNSSKALATMNVLKSIGINPSGFSRLLSTRFYAHIVRPQLEYGLAINRFTNTQLKSIEDAQDTCIRKIYGAHRVHILQAQFLYRSLRLPDDALLCRLLPHIRHIRGHQWFLLFKAPLWQILPSTGEELDKHMFKTVKKRFLQQSLEKHQQSRHYKLLSSCRRSVSLDPILWLPMFYAERSRCIRWRIGRLPGGKPHPCPEHPKLKSTRKHAITCLNMHQRLYMPVTITDPLSFLLNMLSSRPSVPSNLALSWSQRWPVICSILHELDQLQHVTVIPITQPHGQKLLE
ncbi:hypothetical protein G6F43_005515 [Rhizopus delemar]|nr:hypothetical protein G6F43_005515 [Rhizopus delemar]